MRTTHNRFRTIGSAAPQCHERLALCRRPSSPVQDMVNYLRDGRQLIPNKAAPVMLPSDEEVLTSNFASYKPGHLYHAGVHGHYFNFGDPVEIFPGGGLRISFTGADPVVAFLTKQAGTNVYGYAVTVPKLIDFAKKPPPRAETIDPAAYFGLFQSSRADITEMVDLEDTETHPFKMYADLLISYIPFLKSIKVRNMKHLREWSVAGFQKCIKEVLKYGELTERQLAAERAARGKRAEAAASSKDGGKEVGLKYAELKEAFGVVAPFYADPFQERFDNIALNADGKPNDESLAKLRADLQYAHRLISNPRRPPLVARLG
jgi:hypothetical protein